MGTVQSEHTQLLSDSSVFQSLTCLAAGVFSSDWVHLLTGGVRDAGAVGSEGGKGEKRTYLKYTARSADTVL